MSTKKDQQKSKNTTHRTLKQALADIGKMKQGDFGVSERKAEVEARKNIKDGLKVKVGVPAKKRSGSTLVSSSKTRKDTRSDPSRKQKPLTVHQKLDLLDSRLRTLKAYETMMEAMAESRLPAPVAEEPEFKAGDLVFFVSSDTIANPPEGIGRVGKEHARGALTGRRSVDVEFSNGLGAYWMDSLRPATPSEVTAFEAQQKEEAKEKEWAKVSVLKEGDACECSTVEERDELLAIGRSAGVKVLNDDACYLNSTGPNVRYAKWAGQGPYLIVTAAPDRCEKSLIDHWIPRPHFRRRLLGTIAARKKEENKVLGFGMKVKTVRNGMDYRLACDRPNLEGFYRLAPPDASYYDAPMMKRDEFTVINT